MCGGCGKLVGVHADQRMLNALALAMRKGVPVRQPDLETEAKPSESRHIDGGAAAGDSTVQVLVHNRTTSIF